MISILRRTFGAMRRWEKLLLLGLAVLFALSTGALLRRFYIANTEIIPVSGGTYIEGSVGTIRMLNPWFTVTNDVNRDITSLVFSGLQRFNPFTGKIEDDMAELAISGGHRIYTLKLRPGLFWHDSTTEQPRPVTADDVLFTYQMMKMQGFQNPILQKNFRGVEIEKIDDRTVQFRLDLPYFFFRSNLTLGILPAHLLRDVPPDRLQDALDFNLAPIGSGPYRFRSMVEADLSTEVTLEKFPEFYSAKPFIERVVFRAFPDYPSLLSDLRNLDGVRHVPRNKHGQAIIPGRYRTFYYALPQYVALFFNLDRAALQDAKLRLGLQLATNKQEIAQTINEQTIVDTPLLEFAKESWQYQFEPSAAQGAFFDSDWHLPEKIRLQQLQEDRERNLTGALILPQPVVLLETGSSLTFTGSYAGLPRDLRVHGVPVRPIPTASGSWSVTLPTSGGSGSVLPGRNAIRLTTPGKTLDTYILLRALDASSFERLREEQKIVDLYGARSASGFAIEDLRTEHGVLRLRRGDEPPSIRQNNHSDALRLTLLTSAQPPSYHAVAGEVAKQWRAVGVEVAVDIPEDRKAFEDRVIRRDYDVLLFGQPLLDNLDSYPYWASSQIQERSPRAEGGDGAPAYRLDANNLSQYASFRADALLEQIRETHDNARRGTALAELRELFEGDVPAVVLYSPTYVFAVSKDILGVDLGLPSLHSDRFLSIHRWSIKQGRTFRAGISWFDFFPWLLTLEKSS